MLFLKHRQRLLDGPFFTKGTRILGKSMGNFLGVGAPGSGVRAYGGHIDATGAVMTVFWTKCVKFGTCGLPHDMEIKINGTPATITNATLGVGGTDLKITFTPVSTLQDTVTWTYTKGNDCILDCENSKDVNTQALIRNGKPLEMPDPVYEGITVQPDGSMLFDGTEDAEGTVWLPDYEGNYKEFGANEPAWRGGRVTGAVGSRTVYVTDGGGTPLPEQPLLTHMPESRNIVLWSNDLEQGGGINTNVAYSNSTLLGNPCKQVTLAPAVGQQCAPGQLNNGGYIAGEIYTFSFKARRVSGSAILQVTISGSAKNVVNFDLSDGSHNTIDGTDIIAISTNLEKAPNVWNVVVTYTAVSSTYAAAIYFVESLTSARRASWTTTDPSVFDISYMQSEQSLAQTMPIFTDGSSVIRPRRDLSFDAATHHDDAVGIWYVEFQVSFSRDDWVALNVSTFSLLYNGIPALAAAEAGSIRFNDSNGLRFAYTDGWNADQLIKLSFRYNAATAKFQVNIDGVWQTEVSDYSGNLGNAGILDGRICLSAAELPPMAYLKTLRRYDSDDASIIDGLTS